MRPHLLKGFNLLTIRSFFYKYFRKKGLIKRQDQLTALMLSGLNYQYSGVFPFFIIDSIL